MLKQLKKILGPAHTEDDLTGYYPLLHEIRQHETGWKHQADATLQAQARALRARAGAGASLQELLVEVYALISETASRVLQMRPYDVQIIAALALCTGKVAEMQTGEGKTLAATMPAGLFALTGQHVHIHTFNDYLARRDATWMNPIYEFLGISTGCIQEGMPQHERKAMYAKDITYLTAKEGGFDYLRTFLVRHPEELIQQRAGLAIVDEVDSLLIDEARIPLVVAGDIVDDKHIDLYAIADLARRLRFGIDYQTNQYGTNIFLNEQGIDRIEADLACGNLYDTENNELLVRIHQALHAQRLLRRDIDYLVSDDKIELVDEFTGRVVDNRKWPHGLQAAIEAKEGIVIQPEGKILGKTTLQHFFSTYPVLSGMTGTASSAAEEFYDMYNMPVVVIPPNKPCQRIDHPDLLFPSKEMKTQAIVAEIRKEHATGRPILVGTANVRESEWLARALQLAGIECQILNAKNDEEEAAVIGGAGMMGAVTISTNMAGRGTDIKLGGEHGVLRDQIVRLGGLYVIGTNRFESQRIDNQLRGRAGRQGDPGESRFFTSMKDDLLVRHELNNLLPRQYKKKAPTSVIHNEIINREVNRTQRIIEGKNFDVRKALWRYASFLEMQRKVIHQLRQQALDGTLESLIAIRDLELHQQLMLRHGADAIYKAECQVTLAVIDRCWMDYLEEIERIRQSIQMVSLGGMNPFREFQKTTHAVFTELLDRVDDEILTKIQQVTITPAGIDIEAEGLLGPSSTWTYLVNDNPLGNRLSSILSANSNVGYAAGAGFMWPLLTLYYAVVGTFRKKKTRG